MKKQPKVFFILVLLLLAFRPVSGLFSRQQAAGELFEKGLFLEEGQGDLRKAIEIYEKVLAQYPEDRETAAKAQLHIGLCYEKLGVEEAIKAFQKVVDTYPEQAASVDLARERLTLLAKDQPGKDRELKIRKVLEGHAIGTDFYGSVSPDGRYISGPDRSHEWNLAIQDLVTGESRCLTRDKGGYAFFSKWSPDGKRLVYDWWFYSEVERSELRIAGLDGSGAETIWSGKGRYIVPYSWSPDGTKILVQITEADRMDLCLISVQDRSVLVLQSHPGSRQAIPIWLGCAFSPDGRSIAYAREVMPEQSKQRDIYLFSLETKEETPLVTHPANEYVLGWSRDGKHVLFASDRTGSIGVWAAEVGEGSSRGSLRLIKDNVGPIIPLGVARDNALYYGYLPRASDIYVAEMDPNSGRVVSQPKKVDLPFDGHNGDPAYSPDGKRLAYVSNRGVFRNISNSILGIHDFSGNEDKEFDLKLISFGQPRWSPDGLGIHTVGCIDPWEWALYRIEAKTGVRRTTIPPEKKTDVYGHGWSSDGKSIYYVECSTSPENPAILEARIVEVGTDSGRKREIHKFSTVNSTGGLFAVSPDGDSLTFVQRIAGNHDTIYKVPVRGGAIKALAKKLLSITCLAWSPDSRFIVFSAWDRSSDKCELMRISADGGNLQRLGLESQAREGISAFSIRPDGRRIAFASGGEAGRQPEVWVMENLFPRKR